MTEIGRFGLPVIPPAVLPEAEPFWAATAEGRLVLPRCNSCGTVIWYPRGICPECHSTEISYIDSPGNGVIYSFTITRHGPGEYRGADAFVLAYVELDEGPRVMTNIVECPFEELHIGQRVTAVFDDTGGGNALLRFRPARG